MKKRLTELVFILDRSGSMRGLESDAIGGFNGMIEKKASKDETMNGGNPLLYCYILDDFCVYKNIKIFELML